MTIHFKRDEPFQPFNVLAFDPGGTTGWAHSWLSSDLLDHPTLLKIEDIALVTGELTEQHYDDLFQLLVLAAHDASVQYLPPLEVVFEPFNYRQFITEDAQGKMRASRHKVNLISAEYIGVIKLACAQLGLTYYDRFTPGEAKSYVTDKKLELLGWLQTPVTPMRHRNDALRQLVKYLIVRRGVRHPITTAWKATV
jgi:hypothetical protein